MSRIVNKYGVGRILLLSLLLAAVVFTVAVFGRSTVTAADFETYTLQTENAELRQILDYFGKGPVDVYASMEDLSLSKPTLTNAKPMRPAIVFGKHFFRFRDNIGDIVMISPNQIAAIRVSSANVPANQ
ncbi:MAG: hypothetical protein JXA52_01050 [Planctomycetes bacterium]|nr:hypothetical protein [Planctomycetota bacterium]